MKKSHKKMKLIDMTCPHCGATLKIDIERQSCFCEYCGAQLLVDDEAQKIQYVNAEQAGYEFEKGRQRAQAEFYTQEEYPAQPQPQVYEAIGKPKKRKTFLWVLGWIFIFPLPLTIIMVKSKSVPLWAKILVIVVAWLVYVLIALRGRTG